MKPTGVLFFPAFDWAISPTHPEREERLLYTRDQIFEEGILDIEGIVEFKPSIATIQDIQRVHFCVPDELSVVTESHLISAGGAKTIAKLFIRERSEYSSQPAGIRHRTLICSRRRPTKQHSWSRSDDARAEPA